MPKLDLVTQIAETLYPLQSHRIEPLPPLFNWRGIYRIHDAHGQICLLRLLRDPQAADAFIATGHLLQWLEQQQYPAPHLFTTQHQELAGVFDGWASLLLSYIDGTVLDIRSTDFAQFGYALGFLHTLPLSTGSSLPDSRWHPAILQAQTARQLAVGYDRVPLCFRPFVAAMREALISLVRQPYKLQLTHGDCWYKNAIKTPSDDVVLIDWDRAGIGLPLLDLGYLLLTSHYDLAQPLHVTADAGKIRAIVDGYQKARPVSRQERALMKSAVQCAQAVHLAEYLEEQPEIKADDVVLRKMRARFDAATSIAELAAKYVM